MNHEHKPIYVILRFDEGMSELSNAVAVTKVFESQEDATAEAARLNTLNSPNEARYEVRISRLVVT